MLIDANPPARTEVAQVVLSQRRADILNLVVDEYIDTATPVSSRALVDRHHLPFSSATVRNELARLEDDGYVTHPHTSAGRVPSHFGYRFYVERLMSEEPVGPEEQRTIEHQFHQAAPGLEQWLQLAASILASAVGNVAVVARPHATVPRLRHVQLVHLRPGAALLVGVMDDGRLQERIVTVPDTDGQPQLSARAARINEHCAAADAPAARTAASAFDDEADAAIALEVAELLDEHDSAAELFIEGVRSALGQPEFSDSERILDAVDHLEAYHLRRVLGPARIIASHGALVRIGDENEQPWLHEWTLVAAPFGDPAGAVGTVAVLGPTRMRYGFTIPRVRYVADLISDLLNEMDA